MFIPGMMIVGQTPVRVVGNIGSIFAHKGIQLLTDESNTANVFFGVSNVSNGVNPGTTGFPLGPGKAVFVPTEDVNELFAISTADDQKFYFFVV